MNLNHVLAFHRVAAAGGFTVAARLSGLSQPTLSAQVRSLERTMGTQLFKRAGRGIRLTPAGEALAKLGDDPQRGAAWRRKVVEHFSFAGKLG